MPKKSWKLAISLVALGLGLVACANTTNTEITVVTREAGSGTRGAFTEITEVFISEDDKDIDQTTKEAVVQNSTEGVISTVIGDKNGIGYISLGSYNEDVKAVAIEGSTASTETILNGEYPIQRPFNIAWKDADELTQDFIRFVLSKQGQEIAVDRGYVNSKVDAEEYVPSNLSGSISIVGSTSVAPLMEKFVEAYRELNPNVTIDITANGSSAGMTSAMEGTADIGMASRELKDSEKEVLEHDAVALDGIVVIVNHQNPVESLTIEQVREIFTGNFTTWDDLGN